MDTVIPHETFYPSHVNIWNKLSLLSHLSASVFFYGFKIIIANLEASP